MDKCTMPGIVQSLSGYYCIGWITKIHTGQDFHEDPAKRVFTVMRGDRKNPGTLKEEIRTYMSIAPMMF